MSWTVSNGKKKCTDCLLLLPLEEFSTFYDQRANKRYPVARCKKCAKIATAAWRKKPENAKKIALYSVEYKEKLRKTVYDHYGNKCICCGESNYLFLTIDHINNDGGKHRLAGVYGGATTYNYIIKNNFPTDLQILCWNCNCGRQRNKGICPHANPITL